MKIEGENWFKGKTIDNSRLFIKPTLLSCIQYLYCVYVCDQCLSALITAHRPLFSEIQMGKAAKGTHTHSHSRAFLPNALYNCGFGFENLVVPCRSWNPIYRLLPHETLLKAIRSNSGSNERMMTEHEIRIDKVSLSLYYAFGTLSFYQAGDPQIYVFPSPVVLIWSQRSQTQNLSLADA